MDFLKEILIEILSKERLEVCFPDMTIDIAALVDSKSYETLQRIRNVVRDDSLTDEECFIKIEHIISILEDVGSSGGFRHDF